TRSEIWSDQDVSVAVAMADVDNDGDIDVVFGNSGQLNTLGVNDGRGNLISGTIASGQSVMRCTDALVAGDVDRDGDIDVVDLVDLWDNEVYVNDGRGAFSLGVRRFMPNRREPHNAALLADLDGDGFLDLVLANATSPSRILYNDGSGGF